MSQKNYLIAGNSAILIVKFFLTSICSLISTSIVIKALGIADFGLYAVIGGILTILVLLNNVMITSTFRFITYEMGKNNGDQTNKIFNTSLVIHISIAIVLFFLIETVGIYYIHNFLNVQHDKVAIASAILRVSSYAMFFNIISVPFQGLIVAHENFKASTVIEILRGLLGLLVAILMMFIDKDKLLIYAVLTAFINIVPAVLFILYCRRVYWDLVNWKFQRDILLYKEMLVFSGWTMLGAAANVGKNSGGALIINNFFGTVYNGAFGIASQINNMVQLFSNSLGQAAIPQITKSYGAGDTKRSLKLTVYLSKYVFFLMLLPSLPIILEADFILEIWLGKVPAYTSLFVQLIILNGLTDCLGGVGAIAQASGKIKYFQITISVFSLLSLPSAFFLYRLSYPPETIIVLFIITSVLNLVVSVTLLHYIIRLNIREYLNLVYLRVCKVVLPLPILFIIKDHFTQGWLRFIVMSFLSTGTLITLIYFVGIEVEERKSIKDFKNNIMIHFFHKRIKRK